jgi:rhamnogalacturonyl hydrolase YesR
MKSMLATSAAPVPSQHLVSRNGIERRLNESLARAIRWVQDHRYMGYEPADGNSSVLFPLTGGLVFPMRVLQQVVLRTPVNIRPLLGVRPHESAIGRGYMAWGYLVMCRRVTSPLIRNEAQACLEWLMVNRAQGYDEFCWGDPYDYATRNGRRPYGEPLLIWSALIGQAFLEAFERLGDEQYLHVAESIGRWVLKLPAEQTDSGLCLSYIAYRQSSIHNSNAMGAAFLARLGSVMGNAEILAIARRAMLYTCARQRTDGSWFYAEDPKYHWIDNFHTGYNLSALKTYRAASNDPSFDEQLSKGAQYFQANFFEHSGRPKYFHDRTYPVDIQCAAQSIETLAFLADEDPEYLKQALKTAEWTIANLQAGDGHFRYRDLGWAKVSTPMLHWGQATMVKALAMVLDRLAVKHV